MRAYVTREDVVGGDVVVERREPAGDDGLAQSLGRRREVAGRAHAAERLPEHGPRRRLQRGAQRFAVRDDRVRAEMREVLALLGRCHAGQRADRRRAPRTALVEQQHAEVLQRPGDPPRAGLRTRRGPRRLAARPALQEQQVRLVEAVGLGDLAGEDRDGPRIGGGERVERHLELVLARGQAGDAVLDRPHATAGTCCVMQCGPPPPKATVVASTPTISRPSNASPSRASASTSLSYPRVARRRSRCRRSR